MRLALRLGRTVAELSERLSYEEWVYWLALERIEGPLGPEREDLQAAQTSATILNLFKKKHQQPTSPADLVPRWGREQREHRRRESLKSWQHFARRQALREAEGHGGQPRVHHDEGDRDR